MLLGIFAGVGLVAAVMGIYSVLAYTVTQRTAEMGIRRALGARPADVMGLVLRQGVALTVGGILAGVVGSAALTRVLESLLFGVTRLDSVSFVTASVVITPVGLAAAYLPARRAARVDPVTAIRYE